PSDSPGSRLGGASDDERRRRESCLPGRSGRRSKRTSCGSSPDRAGYVGCRLTVVGCRATPRDDGTDNRQLTTDNGNTISAMASRDFAFIQTAPNRVFVGWGPFDQLPMRRADSPAFFITDFFLADPHPWRHPAQWEGMSFQAVAERFSSWPPAR